MGTFVGSNEKWAPSARDFFAPKPGTRYNPPSPEATKGQAKHVDNEHARDLLEPVYPDPFDKRGISYRGRR